MGRKGFGLIADEAINAGDFVIEYVGEVIDEAMAAQRRAENEANGQVCQCLQFHKFNPNLDPLDTHLHARNGKRHLDRCSIQRQCESFHQS